MTISILLFPAGSQVSQEIYDALKYEKNIDIYATGADDNNYASVYFDNYIPDCPMISNAEQTILFLQDIIRKNNIKYLYPTFDPVFPFLKKYKDSIPCEIILPSEKAVQICNSKKETYDLFQDTLRVPKQYTKDSFTLPVYVKPIIGYGSRNHKLIKHKEDIQGIDLSENLLLEYLTGEEFTVDCFTNNKGEVIYCNARERLRTVNGLAVTSKTIDIPAVKEIGEIISRELQMQGAWFFQVKYNHKGELCLLEIACRIPGSMSTNRMRGINFPLLTILDRESQTIDKVLIKSISVKSFKIYKTYYQTTLSSFSHVYCDLDDTLIIKDKVNIDLIRLLYKFKNEGKYLYLLTRNMHAATLLEKWKIVIFDEIIIVPSRNDKKSSYIKHVDSIFIDDSYTERKDVSETIQCNVFSPSELEIFN